VFQELGSSVSLCNCPPNPHIFLHRCPKVVNPVAKNFFEAVEVKSLGQDSRSQGRDSNPKATKYDEEVVTSQPRRLTVPSGPVRLQCSSDWDTQQMGAAPITPHCVSVTPLLFVAAGSFDLLISNTEIAPHGDTNYRPITMHFVKYSRYYFTQMFGPQCAIHAYRLILCHVHFLCYAAFFLNVIKLDLSSWIRTNVDGKEISKTTFSVLLKYYSLFNRNSLIDQKYQADEDNTQPSLR
jgi:uncharacterized protein YaiE (UPF0345 family)